MRVPFYLLSIALSLTASAQQQGLHGVVTDPTGKPTANADVELLKGSQVIQSTRSDLQGLYHLEIPVSGQYRLRSVAPTFDSTTTGAIYLKSAADESLDLTVATPTLTQEVTVSATGTPLPEAQTGAAITVLPAADYRSMLEVQDPLRLAAGVQITQVGEIGGSSGLNIRGGDTDANKVLVDGVPASQIGGTVEFANIATVGIGSIEILNEPNSALYGSDAMAGVVNMTSTRATADPLPLFTYSGDAGNFHTYRNEVAASTVYHQFDLYSAYARLQTSNNIPNSEFHNGTYAGNFGWTPTTRDDLRFTIRQLAVSGGQPNAVALYGVPDDAQQKEQDLYFIGAWDHQLTSAWHTLARYGYVRLNGQFNSFGLLNPADLYYYNGAPVTITGGNGYTVSGQASFHYSPNASSYLEHNTDSSIYAQTDYRINPHLMALGAFRFESESGSANNAGTPAAPISRGNYSYTVHFSGDLKNRLFYTLGTGLEDNGLFGFAGTPRASLAYYLLRPSSTGIFTGTKLHGTFGKGIKEPSVYQQENSLYSQLTPAQQAQFHVTPIGPEYSRTYDAGIDQQLLNGKARVGVTYFHDEFTNRVEYVPQQGLSEFGIPAPVVNSQNTVDFGGAYLNSSAFRSQGIETTVEVRLSSHLFTRGGYTYTDAVVQRSFSSDNIYPSYNTAFSFSGIPIGAYSPLDGARPFRIAPHTGFFALNYTASRFHAALTGTLVSRRDDSDFLLDENYGTSLLLPNRNLDGAYQRLELGGGYQLTSRVNLYADIQNLLSEHYYEAFGYPALPLTFRTGATFSFGGESWKLK